MDVLAALEHSAFSTWIRESPSVWAYGFVLFLHTVGLAMLVGPSLVVDLRVLGVAAELPLPDFAPFFRLAWWGFALNAASGVVLFAADATMKAVNPVFYAKLALIAAGMWLLTRIRLALGRDAGPPRWLAAASLVVWSSAIVAGRLLAYFGQDSGLEDLLKRALGLGA